MTKTFTYDDVVRYLYAETSPQENDDIVEALASDAEMLAFYLDSLELQAQMDRIVRTPSEKVTEKIFSYSRQFTTTQPADFSI
ncbi:hypothetical protein [Arundinibacter roseus]|uniref:Anti-sigma factor n=1 Tax=Arundinibacter roseus TaxID=2070510 RepID=A0A4R4KAK7_9BACT|nr:hypothetical protein [Arundinibacter roseus]TDB63616.1 hypothetical protein EZE20_15020 [Arundinibacter roseus]